MTCNKYPAASFFLVFLFLGLFGGAFGVALKTSIWSTSVVKENILAVFVRDLKQENFC